jgi:hypothetical protein
MPRSALWPCPTSPSPSEGGEWIALPCLGLPALKAKVDTGAKTVALHARGIEPFGLAARPKLRLAVHPVPGCTELAIACSAPIRERRYVIETVLKIGAAKVPIEVTLNDRTNMAYCMLIGQPKIVERAAMSWDRRGPQGEGLSSGHGNGGVSPRPHRATGACAPRYRGQGLLGRFLRAVGVAIAAPPLARIVGFLGPPRAAALGLGGAFRGLYQPAVTLLPGIDHRIEFSAGLVPRRACRLLSLRPVTCFRRSVACIVLRLIAVTLLPVALRATLNPVTLLRLAVLLLLARILFTLGFGKHPKVVLGMLLKVFRRDPVIRQLRIARQLVVFVDDLLRRAADFSLGTGRLEHAVDDVADRAVAVPLGPRAVF